jgi:hypothetical protein
LEEIGLDYNAAELFTRFGELSDVDFSQAVDEGKIKKGKGVKGTLPLRRMGAGDTEP